MKTRWMSLLLLALVVLIVGGLAWKRLSSGAAGEQPLDDAVAPTSVHAARVSRGTVQSWVLAEGTARSVRREFLTFENSGRIVFVMKGEDGDALREGDCVSAGEVLVRQDQRAVLADISSAEASVEEARTQVAVAEAELSRARTESDLTSKTLERFSVLLGQESASKQEYDEATAGSALAGAAVSQAVSRLAASRAKVTSAESRLHQEQLALEKTELSAPMDGVLAYVNIKEGYYFTPSLVRTDEETAALQTVPIVIIDPTAFEVTIHVPSFNRGRVRAGQAVVISVSSESPSALGSEAPPAESDGTALGTVFSVNPAVSPGGRSVQVKIRSTADVTLLEDGLFVTVWIAADSREDVLRLPVEAVLYQDNSPYVFAVEDGRAVRHPVTLGLREFSMQEVISGLTEGQLVVTQGRFKMSEGVSVQLLDQSRGAP